MEHPISKRNSFHDIRHVCMSRNTKAHPGREGVGPFTMRSFWHLPCAMAVEILLLCGCVSALFNPGNVGCVARTISAAQDHATSSTTITGTSASTGSIQRSSGLYFGEEYRRSTTIVLRMLWSLKLLCLCEPVACSPRTHNSTTACKQ